MDKDGFISNGELFQVLKMMVGTNLTDTQLQQIVDKTIFFADKDGDGKINFEEFCAVSSHCVLQYCISTGSYGNDCFCKLKEGYSELFEENFQMYLFRKGFQQFINSFIIQISINPKWDRHLRIHSKIWCLNFKPQYLLNYSNPTNNS